MLKFRIPIGDWSGDGHNMCDYFTALADADTIEQVREGYFKACDLLPENTWPANICRDYGVNTLDAEQRKTIADHTGYEFREGLIDSDTLAKYVAHFINFGAAFLNVRVTADHDTDMLPFYGYDKKRRHLSCGGYGLFDHE